MTHTIPNKAFILAAGLGTRLRPYTNDTPKPLVKVDGHTLLDRTLDHLHDAGVNEAVLNLHYLPGQIPEHLKSRTDFTFHYSLETELLDTGGGIKKALEHFNDAFFVLSGDGLWENKKRDDPQEANTLQIMTDAWNPEIMDILILLQPVNSMKLTHGVGDYDITDTGHAIRSLDKTGKYMFTSMRINHPRIFEDTPDGAFSYLDLLDKAQNKDRLYALVHEGDWHHISTTDDLERVNEAYKNIKRIPA